MNGVCGFGVRTAAHLFICSGLNAAEQGWRSGPRWVLLSHQGQLSRETGGRGGGTERRKEDRLPGWETRSRSIFPSSLSVMSSHLSVSADDTLSLPIGPFPGQQQQKKPQQNQGGGVCIRLGAAGWCVRACVRVESTHTPGGCQSWRLSNFPLPQDCERADERAPSGEPQPASSPASVPAEVAASRALSVQKPLEVSSS